MIVSSINELTVFLKNNKNDTYIVGKGNYGQLMKEWLKSMGIVCSGYIDKEANENVEGEYNYSKIGNLVDQSSIFIISSRIYKERMIDELLLRGVNIDNIVQFLNSEQYYDIVRASPQKKQQVSGISQWHNKYCGDRCFIIGNGPSLRLEDVEKLTNEITFAVNNIYGFYKYTTWRPTFYCFTDPSLSKTFLSDLVLFKSITNDCKAVFTSVMNPVALSNYSNNMYYFIYEDYEKGVQFSEDCAYKVCAAGTVIYCAIQLAFYMGFNEIYFLGMDFNYNVVRHIDGSIVTQNIENHPKELEDVEDEATTKRIIEDYGYSYMADVDIQLDGYKNTKKHADKVGAVVKNATRGGKLEVFPRIDFDNLMESIENEKG